MRSRSQDAFAGTNAESPYQGFDAGYTTFNQNYLLSVTHTFSPRLVSQSKVVFNRLNQLQPLGEQPATNTLYLTGGTASILGIQTALPGYLPYTPGSAIPFGGPQNLGQLYEDVSWIKGNHTFRFGGSYIYLRDNRAFGAYAYAVEQLGKNLASGMENFLKGQLVNYTAAVYPQGKYPGDTVTCRSGRPTSRAATATTISRFYGQDTWRLGSGLTLNLGLRWEYYRRAAQQGSQEGFELLPGQRALHGRADQEWTSHAGSRQPLRRALGQGSQQPRPPRRHCLGCFGNGKTSLRGGYGISYERNFGNVTFNVIQNPPNYARCRSFPADVGGISSHLYGAGSVRSRDPRDRRFSARQPPGRRREYQEMPMPTTWSVALGAGDRRATRSSAWSTAVRKA